MTNAEVTRQNVFADEQASIQAIINESLEIEHGVILSEIADGIVNVATSVSASPDDTKIYPCVLANVATKYFSVNTHPQEGDKVLVFYPRRYNGTMFNLDLVKPIYDEVVSGKTLASGIAVPLNQFKADYKNFADFGENGVTLNLAYSADDEKNLYTLTIDNEGNAVLTSGNVTATTGTIDITSDKTNVNITDNTVTVKNENTTITIDAGGAVTIDMAKDTKFSVKNSSKNLYTILNAFMDKFNQGDVNTAGSPANHKVVPGQFATIISDLGALME